MARPRISIAIPAYNAARTLPETLDSILAQEYEEWDASVVDDGSTDETVAILERYCAKDPRIHFVSQENAGTGAAMNVAFQNANGDLIAQFGADDQLMPEYMTTMAAFIAEYPGYDIYSCNAWLILPGGRRRLYAEDPLDRPWVSMGLEELLEAQPYFLAGGALIARPLFERLGGFRPEMYCEDVDFGRRALASGAKHIYCPQPLIIYDRDVEGQKSADRARIISCVIRIDEDLLASGDLIDAQKRLVETAIARNRERLAHGGTVRELSDEAMERQAAGLRTAVIRVVGEAPAEKVLALLHRVSGPSRPLRRAVTLLTARLARRGKGGSGQGDATSSGVGQGGGDD